jgi:hypothetical protein
MGLQTYGPVNLVAQVQPSDSPSLENSRAPRLHAVRGDVRKNGLYCPAALARVAYTGQ